MLDIRVTKSHSLHFMCFSLACIFLMWELNPFLSKQNCGHRGHFGYGLDCDVQGHDGSTNLLNGRGKHS